MVIGKVCDEFHSSSISYPPTSLLELLKIFRNLKINALHIYVSYCWCIIRGLKYKYTTAYSCIQYYESTVLVCLTFL